MQVEIDNTTYNEIKRYLNGHKFYKNKFTIEEMINTMVNIGWYAYQNDGIEGSIHPEKGGDFGVHC